MPRIRLNQEYRNKIANRMKNKREKTREEKIAERTAYMQAQKSVN